MIVAQDNVTPLVGKPGLLYPLIGLMTIVPWPPLPAGTLLGTTGFCTVMVNWGVTAKTVKPSGCVLCVVEGPVPVMVTL